MFYYYRLLCIKTDRPLCARFMMLMLLMSMQRRLTCKCLVTALGCLPMKRMSHGFKEVS